MSPRAGGYRDKPILLRLISRGIGNRQTNLQYFSGRLWPPADLICVDSVSGNPLQLHRHLQPRFIAVIGNRFNRLIKNLQRVGIKIFVGYPPTAIHAAGRIGFNSKIKFGFNRIDQDHQFRLRIAGRKQLSISVERLQREPVFAVGLCLKRKFRLVGCLAAVESPSPAAIRRLIKLNFDQGLVGGVDLERHTKATQFGCDNLGP